MQRSDDLRQALDRLYAALVGDVASDFGSLLSRRELLMIGTAPEEWWEGHDEVVRVVRAQAEALGQAEIIGSNPTIREAGEVGWIADRATMRLTDGTEVPLRITAVWRREDGQWRLVQGHSSIGVSNAEGFNQDVIL